jgi:hypothetical protein
VKLALAAILTICMLLAAWTFALLTGRAARRPQRCVLCRSAPAVPGLDVCQRCWLDDQRGHR